MRDTERASRPQMDAKFLRNLKFSKKWQKGGRPKEDEDGSDEEEEDA